MVNFTDRLFKDVISSNLDEGGEKRKKQLIVLLEELVTKLKEVCPSREKDISDGIDLEYLEMVISRNVINVSDFAFVVFLTIEVLLSYCAPVDDHKIRAYQDGFRLKIEEFNPNQDLTGKELDEIITDFFLNANKMIVRILELKTLFLRGMKPFKSPDI